MDKKIDMIMVVAIDFHIENLKTILEGIEEGKDPACLIKLYIEEWEKKKEEFGE